MTERRRSEKLRRLTRTPQGGFACDQRDAGGELWLIERHGRSDWAIRAHRSMPERRWWQRRASVPSATIVGSGELRGWVNARAAELERTAPTS